MEVLPTLSSAKGSAEMFTGDVHFEVTSTGNEPSRMRVNVVRFPSGARTAWHCHAVGQTLHVTGTEPPRPLHDPPRHVGSTKP